MSASPNPLKRAFCLAWLACLLIAAPVLADRLAVVSRSDNLVAFIDLESGEITSTVATGNNPHEMAADSNRRFAYVPAYGGNRIAKVDLANEALVDTFEIDDHRAMHSAAWLNGALWVTAEQKKVVLKVDPESGAVVAEFPTGGDVSHMVIAVAAHDRLYTANMDSANVSSISAESGAMALIATGAGAEGIDATPDGSAVWISNREENTISIIDTENNAVQREFSSEGNFPVKLRMRPDGKEVWVANNLSASIAVFDAETLEHKRNIEVGARPLGIIFSDDSSKGYVSRPGASVVLEIETSSGEILRSIKAPKSPDGMVYLSASP